MTNAIVLGAGASYGSQIENKPPLTTGLYTELAAFDPDVWGKLKAPYPELFLGLSQIARLSIVQPIV